jgi:hypothetical protein
MTKNVELRDKRVLSGGGLQEHRTTAQISLYELIVDRRCNWVGRVPQCG